MAGSMLLLLPRSRLPDSFWSTRIASCFVKGRAAEKAVSLFSSVAEPAAYVILGCMIGAAGWTAQAR